MSTIQLPLEGVGEYPIVCDAYCGLVHHLMLDSIIVTEQGSKRGSVRKQPVYSGMNAK